MVNILKTKKTYSDLPSIAIIENVNKDPFQLILGNFIALPS
jgi:hypothetical protein